MTKAELVGMVATVVSITKLVAGETVDTTVAGIAKANRTVGVKAVPALQKGR